MSQVSNDAGIIADYQYNGLGQRVYKNTASGSEYSLYGPDGKRIATLNGSGALLQNTLYWQQAPLAKFEPAEEVENVYRFASSSWLFWKPSANLDVWPENKTFSLKRYSGDVLTLNLNGSQWRQDRLLGHELVSISYKGPNRLTVTGWMKLETDRSSHLPHHSRIPSEIMLIVNQPGRLAEIYTMKGQLEEHQEPTLNTYYYHNDHLGTPQLMTGNQQEVVWQASYDAFGMANVMVNEVESDLRFPGQYFDGETGLHYNYFRDYDPGVGRYVQSDPLGLDGGMNTYDYAKSSPLRYIDPLGLIWVTIGYDYHGVKNWSMAFANRLGALNEGTIMSPHNCVACTRDVIQEWQEHPNDPPCGPESGDQRKIKQVFGDHPDSWSTTGYSWYWSPAVESSTWKNYQ